MKRVPVEMPEDIHEELKVRAARMRITLKDLIVRILREGMYGKDV
jgi:plasmid stability protein